MAKEKEILRLHFEGMSQRDICAALRCGHTKANAIIAAARKADLTSEAISVMDDSDIRALLAPESGREFTFAKPDFEHLSKELALPGVTRKLLWHEYCTNISDDKASCYGYAQFCRLFDQHLKINGAKMRLTHEPGQRMFVDWAGDFFECTDALTGLVTKAWLFVACMPYSDIIFAKAYMDMKQASWQDGHMSAFEYFGGVPSIVVPDNCATATDRSSIYLTLINDQYYEFASYYSTAIVPARVRKSNDKALVESAVLICERQMMAPLRHERFFSINDLNSAIAKRLEVINDTPFQKRDGTRFSVFNSEEKHLLKPLPPKRYEQAIWKKAKVGADYHVCIETMRYSVSYKHIGQVLEVCIASREVRIFKDGRELCVHKRLVGKKGQYSTEREHMPKRHQDADISWTPERFKRWAAEIGEYTGEVIERILDSKTIVEQAFVPCLNILGLAKRGRRELLEAACKDLVLREGYPSYTAIKNTMAALKSKSKGTQGQGFIQLPATDALGDAGRVRGAGYYAIKKESADV